MEATKKTKIVLGINSLVTTKHQAYSNHIQLFYRLGRNYPNLDVVLVNPSRMSIDRMRNLCAETALQVGAEYVLFLDDDVLVPHDCLAKLIDCDADIACGDVIIRGYPFQRMVFFHPNGNKHELKFYDEYPEDAASVLDIDACGFSLCLIKTSLLAKLRKPFFVTGPTNTEDIYFCMKAREAFPDTTIRVDRTIECAHILWEEVIMASNLKNYKEYFEKQNPEVLIVKEELNKDRGDEYLEMVEGISTQIDERMAIDLIDSQDTTELCGQD